MIMNDLRLLDSAWVEEGEQKSQRAWKEAECVHHWCATAQHEGKQSYPLAPLFVAT